MRKASGLDWDLEGNDMWLSDFRVVVALVEINLW